MPDIDIDFQDDRRSEVIDYVRKKYGDESVSGIITFGTLSARSVIRDVARVLEYDYSFGDKLAKSIPEVPGMTLTKAFETSPEFDNLYKSNSDVKRVVDIAMKLEGLPRHKSQHACGHVITDGKVSDYVPEVLVEDKEIKGLKNRTAGFNMVELEELGLLKMDFLGLRNMGILGEAIKLINKRDKLEKPIKYEEIDLEDPYIYKFIATGNTAGIFQIESPGMQSLMKQMFADVSKKIGEIEGKYNFNGYLNPKYFGKKDIKDLTSHKDEYLREMKTFGKELFERLVAAISLYRPGPMDYIPDYIAGMNNPKNIKYDTPELEEILKTTYGVIVYQEQVQQIVRTLAGYSLGRGDLIRRAMGKKDMKIMEAEKEVFLYGNAKTKKKDEELVVGCVANGIKEEVAIVIWDKMVEFANYAFNKSHSAGYAVISASTAFLRNYFPLEFFVATLNSVIKNQDKLKYYLSELSKAEIELLPPDINKSNRYFTIEGDSIRFGLMGLRNFGKMADKIIEEQKNGEFVNLEDFIDRMILHIDKKMLEALIYSGAIDSFENSGTRQAKISAIPEILEFSRKVKSLAKEVENIPFRLPELDIFYNEFNKIQIDKEMEEFDKRFKVEQEHKFAGFYITDHPLNEHLLKIEQVGTVEIIEILPDKEDENSKTSDYDNRYVKVAGILKEVKPHYTRKGDLMYFLEIEDKTAIIKGVMFPSNVEGHERSLENEIVILEGKVQCNEMGTQIIANKITKIEEYETEEPKAILFIIKNEDQLKIVKNLIDKYKGSVNVYVDYNDQKYKHENGIDLNLSSLLEIRKIFNEYKVV